MEQQAAQQDANMKSSHKHSRVLIGYRTMDEVLHWRYTPKYVPEQKDEIIEVKFFLLMRNTPAPQKDDAIKTLLTEMKVTDVPWLVTGRKEWAFNLDMMKDVFEDLKNLDWCRGRVFVEPDFEVDKEGIDIIGKKYYETYITFHISPEALGMTPALIPPEIQLSLRDFQLDYPAPQKVAFIMMRFGSTPAHNKIVQGIQDALAPHGIKAVRADDKDWHTDLFYNVLTCIYGCTFGIAIFERIESEDFNPNVALEVGYIMALKKQVCLLKDRTLKSLHTDLVGKLYKTFDPQDPIASIPPELTKWMQDKKLI